MYDHILTHFLSTDQLRPALTQPNTIDGIVYATDAHHVVAIPAGLLEKEYPAHERVPDMKKVWPIPARLRDTPLQLNPETIQSAILAIPRVEKEERIDCDTCDGEGEIKCDYCRHSHECDDCRGLGTVTTGKKTEQADECYTICIEHNTHFNPRFLFHLLHCAEATQQPILLHTHSDGKAALFQTGEIQVIIMPSWKKENSEYVIHLETLIPDTQT